ncbi:hypothetical protein Patl1_04583 [Pistacia atlantica]|uniref:Uncharacterized protein n=1 Tax=Pistacia atlantica TaxID=434234 RepID=A0ACC1BUH4_9ROSI|nr:hypothetical protein Patl1_04583 [Pistacia atlantica]
MDPTTIIEVINWIAPPICRYWKYHRKFNEILSSLESMREDLSIRMENIELRLNGELRYHKVPNKEVESWLRKAKKIIEEIQRIEDKFSKGNYFLRGWRGKLVDEKIQEVKGVYDQGVFLDGLVIDAPDDIGLPLPTSEMVGEVSVKEKIWKHLIGDEVRKIGVCGMGGVGKTTIMKHIHNQLLEERNKFDKVIWATISKEYDVVKLQQDIATALGEDLSKQNDITTRAAVLQKMLKGIKRYVLILDDVWKKISLEEVGIPEPAVMDGCKLVLTTRSTEVARSMGCEVIKVEPLSEMEAFNLFLSKVGFELLHVPTLQSTLKLIVKQCGGLPLAIVTLASSMKGERDVHIWGNALNELKVRIGSVEDMVDEVLESLKFSYDRLRDPKIKHCFLCCALYPEDFAIDKEELIEYWIVEGFIDELESREAMYNKGHANLKRLEENCLLESADDEKRVKMHDLVRDMALYITSQSPRYLVKAGMQLRKLPTEHEWTEDLQKVSLMRNYIYKFRLDMTLPKFTALSTLLLQDNKKLREIDDSVFTLMIELKVLNLSGCESLRNLPNSISGLVKLTALLLNRCCNLQHVPSLAKLGALKKLDLGWTGITAIPDGLEMLVHLRYLDLNARFMNEMPGGILPKLFRLQYLRLDNAVAEAEEVSRLSKLECLGIRFRNLQEDHIYFSLKQQRCLNYYSFNSVGLDYFFIEGRRGKAVGIGGLTNFGDSIKIPTDIQTLFIDRCDDLRSVSDISSLKDATDWRECWIYQCKQMEYFCYLSSHTTAFQTLEYLFVECLDNLIAIVGEEIDGAPGIFSCLKTFQIGNCPKLKRLFPPKLLRNLQNLEEIEVWSCSGLVEIVEASSDEEEEDKEASKNSVKLSLPNLRSIVLRFLPELRSFCKSCYAIHCDSLRSIYIEGCPKLKTISPLFPQPDNGQPFPPASLERLRVRPKEWWNSLEWDHPNTKNVLERFLEYSS